jgi:hypothetical protein
MAMRPGSVVPVELRGVFKGCPLLADADDKSTKPPPLMDLVLPRRAAPRRAAPLHCVAPCCVRAWCAALLWRTVLAQQVAHGRQRCPRGGHAERASERQAHAHGQVNWKVHAVLIGLHESALVSIRRGFHAAPLRCAARAFACDCVCVCTCA